MTDKPLTPPQVAVLRAAADGNLRRSRAIRDLNATYIEERGRDKNVTAVVRRLLDREPRLLEIGEDDRRWSDPWLLTDAGRAELDRIDQTTR